MSAPKPNETRHSGTSTDSVSPTSTSDQLVDHFFRHEYGQLVASLTRRFGVRNWELAEDAIQYAMSRAMGGWSRQGIPQNPAAWLHRVASNHMLDVLRRESRQESLDEATLTENVPSRETVNLKLPENERLNDDLLRMIFVCCHPEVAAESQLALALKTLCGFGNREIARSLLTTEMSVAKRLTRAKQRLRELRVEPSDLDEVTIRNRLPHVHSVVYLLFNEGYSSSLPDRLIREELCEEAVRLALLMAEHPLTQGGESSALLALLLFHAARLDARIDANGVMLLLKEQDRSRWDRRLMAEGYRWLDRATGQGPISRFHAEALIAAEHCYAQSLDETNWHRIVQAYDLLCRLAPSPIHDLNRAIAIGHHHGPDAGTKALSQIESDRLERDYYLWHAARADLAAQTKNFNFARQALEQARDLAPTNAEKELICRKLDALGEDTAQS
ncbi:MAG: sigma-70 family RNA polymerase sigma factor [Pirellulaceae bacterium]